MSTGDLTPAPDSTPMVDPYPHECTAPKWSDHPGDVPPHPCGQPARMYLIGPRCDDHRPRTAR